MTRNRSRRAGDRAPCGTLVMRGRLRLRNATGSRPGGAAAGRAERRGRAGGGRGGAGGRGATYLPVRSNGRQCLPRPRSTSTRPADRRQRSGSAVRLGRLLQGAARAEPTAPRSACPTASRGCSRYPAPSPAAVRRRPAAVRQLLLDRQHRHRRVDDHVGRRLHRVRHDEQRGRRARHHRARR